MPAMGALVVGLLTTPLATRASAAPTAAAIGVQASDVPGFAPTANQTVSNPTDQGFAQSFLHCAGTNVLLRQFDTGPGATLSGLYGQGTGPLGTSADSVFSVVFTDGSASDAASAFTDLTGTAFASCWASEWEAITTAIEGGLATVLSPYHVEPMSTPTVAGAQVGGYSLDVTISALGVTLSDAIGVTGIHVGDFVAMLVTVGSGQPFSTALRATLTSTIAQRMGARPTTTTVVTTPSPPQSCLRPGIPDPQKPILTDAQVEAIVRGKVQFAGSTTNGTTVCVWSRTIRHVTDGSTPVDGTLTWQVAIDGPLASTSAAHRAYTDATRQPAVAIVVPHLGDRAELVAGTTQPQLLVQAGTYFLEFDSVNAAPETQAGILSALAEAVLLRLNLAPTGSPKPITKKTWPTDWAGPTFCKDNDQPFLDTFRGVASCGVRYVKGERTNLTGPVCYPVSHPPGSCKGSNVVVFNLTGFQCVEYALRYFYFMTGIRTTRLDDNGDDVATELYYAFRAKNPQLGLDPLTSKRRAKGLTVGTSRYNPSLRKGDIISMWSASDVTGHVAVVKQVAVHKNSNGTYSGQLTMINENAQGGVTPISITNNRLTYGDGYFTRFQWLTGLPTS